MRGIHALNPTQPINPHFIEVIQPPTRGFFTFSHTILLWRFFTPKSRRSNPNHELLISSGLPTSSSSFLVTSIHRPSFYTPNPSKTTHQAPPDPLHHLISPIHSLVPSLPLRFAPYTSLSHLHFHLRMKCGERSKWSRRSRKG